MTPEERETNLKEAKLIVFAVCFCVTAVCMTITAYHWFHLLSLFSRFENGNFGDSW